MSSSSPAEPTRWLLVDGFTGAGKSSIAQRIARRLAWAGERARWLHEWHRDHPLRPTGERDFTAALRALGPEGLSRAAVERWRRAPEAGGSLVLDGYPFFATVGALVLCGAGSRAIRELVAELRAQMRGRRVVLFHLDAGEVSGALERVCERRGEQFRDSFLTWLQSLPAFAHGGGSKNVHEVLGRVLDEVRFAACAADAILLDVMRDDLEAVDARVAAVLDLPDPPRETRPLFAPGAYVGGQRRVEVAVEDGRTFLSEAGRRLRLLGFPDGAAELEGWPTTVRLRHPELVLDETWIGGELVRLRPCAEVPL